jgi:hypothetical protein
VTVGPDAAVDALAGDVRLDTSGEPWCGVVPGYGRVLVDAEGDVEVLLDAGADPAAAAALRWGWGEPLSFLRRGSTLLLGTTLADPAGRALLLTGGLRGVPRLAALLVARGWVLMADGLAPVSFPQGDGPVLAQARQAPLLLHSRMRDQLGLPAVPLRSDPGVCRGERGAVPEVPVPLDGVLRLETRGDAEREQVAPLQGTAAWSVVVPLPADPAARTPLDPGQHTAALARLAALRVGVLGERVCLVRPYDAVAAVLAWWEP